MKCHGRLRGLPPYVGGDDDETTSWQAECACGYLGRETPYQSVAYGELIEHLNAALKSGRKKSEAYEEALAFYANPETYFACAFFFDPPCGDFKDDFELLSGNWGHPDGGDWVKPGKRAREALAEMIAEAG